jgi:hypothetical protein
VELQSSAQSLQSSTRSSPSSPTAPHLHHISPHGEPPHSLGSSSETCSIVHSFSTIAN